MSSKAYTSAQRIAAAFLARLNGSEAAATAFGIDPRTVRSWQDTVPVPDDQWTAIRDVLLARGAEMAATGKTTGLAAVLTGAGISDRNVRYGQLIARREARRTEEQAPPEPDLVKEALHAMSDERGRWLRDTIQDRLDLDAIRAQNGEPDPAAEQEWTAAHPTWTEADSAAWIQHWTEATPEQLDAHREEINADARELLTGWTASRAHAPGAYAIHNRSGAEFVQVGSMAGIFASVPLLVDSGDGINVTPEEVPEPTERPALPAVARVARPTPLPKVIDTGYAPSTWHELERRDRP